MANDYSTEEMNEACPALDMTSSGPTHCTECHRKLVEHHHEIVYGVCDYCRAVTRSTKPLEPVLFFDALLHEAVPTIRSAAASSGGFLMQLEVHPGETIQICLSELQLMMLHRAIKTALGI